VPSTRETAGSGGWETTRSSCLRASRARPGPARQALLPHLAQHGADLALAPLEALAAEAVLLYEPQVPMSLETPSRPHVRLPKSSLGRRCSPSSTASATHGSQRVARFGHIGLD
jgi:hypothetical protein